MSAKALTDTQLRKLQATGKRYELTDAKLSGLRARVSATGKVSFVLKARGANGKLTTVTIGHYPELSLKVAREKATRHRLDLKAGKNPNDEKRAARAVTSATGSEPTLRELLREYEAEFGAKKKVWAPAGPQTQRTQAGRVIERVFAKLLDKPVTKITEQEFANSILTYQRVLPTSGSSKANGQASKARSYLSPVLDWAAGRNSYSKIGASRACRLSVVSLANIHDPSADDPAITGKRKRVLSHDELHTILPLLSYPAPNIDGLGLQSTDDFRPIAMRFILYTAARLEEVCSMRWRDLDRRNGVWRKPSVKSTKGGQRDQELPLPEAALSILRALPGWETDKPDKLVFPNSTGEKQLGNWTRFQKALYNATGTSDWHRHDLRRTAATLMHSLKIPASTVEQILAHAAPLKSENAGAAASHYLQLTQIMKNQRDPQEQALAALAEALEYIETEEG